MAPLELPGLELLALAVRAELDPHAAGAGEGGGAPCAPPLRLLLVGVQVGRGAHLVALGAPRLGELVHVELELPVAAHRVVALVPVVVAAQAAETAAQVGRGHHLHEAVAVPRDLQACRGREGGPKGSSIGGN